MKNSMTAAQYNALTVNHVTGNRGNRTPATPPAKPRRKPRNIELMEQTRVFNLCRTLYVHGIKKPVSDFLIHIPNEGKRSQQTGAALKKAGLRPGVSDLLLAIPIEHESGLWIEMKGSYGLHEDYKPAPVSGEQFEFIDDMIDMGYAAHHAFGFDATFRLILGYLATRLDLSRSIIDREFR